MWRRLSLVLMLLAASALGHFDRSLLDGQWKDWKLTHRRDYSSQVSEDDLRAPTFADFTLNRTLPPEGLA